MIKRCNYSQSAKFTEQCETIFTSYQLVASFQHWQQMISSVAARDLYIGARKTKSSCFKLPFASSQQQTWPSHSPDHYLTSGLQNVEHAQQQGSVDQFFKILIPFKKTLIRFGMSLVRFHLKNTVKFGYQLFTTYVQQYSIVGFNVPLDTIIGHFGDDFTGQ